MSYVWVTAGLRMALQMNEQVADLAAWLPVDPEARAALEHELAALGLDRPLSEHTVGARKTIVKENAPFAGLHVIRSGNVKLCKVCGDKEQILELLGPGDVIDPIPLFDGGGYAVTAKAMSPTVVLRFSPEAAHTLIARHPEALTALLNLVSLRLRKLATLANDLAFKDVTARLCTVLLERDAEQAAGGGRALARPLTRQELAGLVGTAREVAWRALKKLEQEDLIAIRGGDIIILDPAALAARA